jgi:hypothetical protein
VVIGHWAYVFDLVQAFITDNSISLHAVDDLLPPAILLMLTVLDKHSNELVASLINDNGVDLYQENKVRGG